MADSFVFKSRTTDTSDAKDTAGHEPFLDSGSNPKGETAHWQSRGNNVFGFEDLPANAVDEGDGDTGHWIDMSGMDMG